MPKKFRPINVEEVKALLDYDPATGKFTWKVDRRNRRKKGDPACNAVNTDGYYCVRLNNVLYKAQRIAWAIYHNQDPGPLEIDHKNGNRLDNRIDNLRLVPDGCNPKNSPKKPFNTSGYKGVSWHKGAQKWAASITVNKVCIHLGLFTDIEEANKAAINARDFWHGEYARHD